MPLQKKKYEQAILYLCSRLGREIKGKKKLAKLLYFVDFDFFEKYHKPITGDIYQALPMGPFPSTLNRITEGMKKDGVLLISQVENHEGYAPTEVYTAQKDPDEKAFLPEEKAMLDRVIKKYGHLNGKQLEELTHAEAPYVGTAPKKEIAYELAYYRETDFSDC